MSSFFENLQGAHTALVNLTDFNSTYFPENTAPKEPPPANRYNFIEIVKNKEGKIEQKKEYFYSSSWIGKFVYYLKVIQSKLDFNKNYLLLEGPKAHQEFLIANMAEKFEELSNSFMSYQEQYLKEHPLLNSSVIHRQSDANPSDVYLTKEMQILIQDIEHLYDRNFSEFTRSLVLEDSPTKRRFLELPIKLITHSNIYTLEQQMETSIKTINDLSLSKLYTSLPSLTKKYQLSPLRNLQRETEAFITNFNAIKKEIKFLNEKEDPVAFAYERKIQEEFLAYAEDILSKFEARIDTVEYSEINTMISGYETLFKLVENFKDNPSLSKSYQKLVELRTKTHDKITQRLQALNENLMKKQDGVQDDIRKTEKKLQDLNEQLKTSSPHKSLGEMGILSSENDNESLQLVDIFINYHIPAEVPLFNPPPSPSSQDLKAKEGQQKPESPSSPVKETTPSFVPKRLSSLIGTAKHYAQGAMQKGRELGQDVVQKSKTQAGKVYSTANQLYKEHQFNSIASHVPSNGSLLPTVNIKSTSLENAGKFNNFLEQKNIEVAEEKSQLATEVKKNPLFEKVFGQNAEVISNKIIENFEKTLPRLNSQEKEQFKDLKNKTERMVDLERANRRIQKAKEKIHLLIEKKRASEKIDELYKANQSLKEELIKIVKSEGKLDSVPESVETNQATNEK